ncbi:cytochrome P450 [Kocuria kalidii]|uniref:cytochrome P450 n=1 Tax=Kocuria kalidii TaxID=3376283 RepID=UPI00378BE254
MTARAESDAPMTVPASTVPVLSEDPFGDDVLTDPLPFHAALREAGPVVRLAAYGIWAMGRYAEVHTSLTDWQGFQSAAGVGLSDFKREKPWRPPSLLLEADPPQHDAPRHVLANVLSPRALKKLRPAWAADAEELVAEVLAGPSEFDAVAGLAEAFPLRVFPDAVGLSQGGREHLLPYGDHVFNAFGPVNHLVEKGQPRVAELGAWVASRCTRDVLAPEGFGADIWAAADRGEITPQQAPLIVRSLLTAGVDTTVHALSAILHSFAAHPNEWTRLRADPSLVRTAFDEAIRLESPVQTFFRTTTQDLRVAGADIPEGEKVLLFLGAANRDPRRWEDPDDFDLSRDPSGHVGFGMGIHQCVGQHVARLEAEALLLAMIPRIRRIELTGPPQRHLNNTLRAWGSLPVRVELER